MNGNHHNRFKTTFFSLIIFVCCYLTACNFSSSINRFDLVTRHNIEHSIIDSLSSLSLGNGDFAFTVDITGLQTFPEIYEKGIPLGTMSNWGWHRNENTENFQLTDVYKSYEVHGRTINYVHQFRDHADSRKVRASEWLRTNPHRIHLGMIGLQIVKKDGSEINIQDITNPVQKLDLWTGMIKSKFYVEGSAVEVHTVCHPKSDLVSVKITSRLISTGQLKIKIHFPLGTPLPSAYDFNKPEKHSTKIISGSTDHTIIEREQTKDRYYFMAVHRNARITEVSKHLYYIIPELKDSSFESSFCFSKSLIDSTLYTFRESRRESRRAWKEFWTSGAAADFSQCTDPRAFELERRVILSQYLTKIQCSGSLPPAETGLTYNSWYGKFHLEMHWWHAVHFALWKRENILKKQMDYYNSIFDKAMETAKHQGYSGVRWPKMTGPDGRESPSTVGTYLIWQQPHFIFFSELLYKNAENKEEILNKYNELVFETANFMASYAFFDSVDNRYILGPVLIPAQESLKPETTINPVFELAYWYWALKTALEWRSRLKLEPDPLWADVVSRLSALPEKNGVYLCSEDTEDSYENTRYLSDHPVVSGILGALPATDKINKDILRNSLDSINIKWNWPSAWGWDFPMLALSAASLHQEEKAIDFLLMQTNKNKYLLNGHNYQRPNLAVYLPGNGGLLTAIAKMCISGQFPKNGKWNVKWENFNNYVD